MRFSLLSPFSLSLITKSFFFVILAITPQAQDHEYYSKCNQPFECKSIKDIKYPFWGSDRPSYCGLQGYELICQGTEMHPGFDMRSQSFFVLNISRSNFTMTIARKDLFDNICPSQYIDTNINTSLVEGSRIVEHITFFYNCDLEFWKNVGQREKFNCPYNYSIVTLNELLSKTAFFTEATEKCVNKILVPVMQENMESFENGSSELADLVRNGFEVSYESQAKMIICRDCEKSGGICGTSAINVFTCFCKDQPREFSCPGSVSGRQSNVITLFIIGVSVIVALLSIIGVWYFYKIQKKKISKKRKVNFSKEHAGLLLQQQLLCCNNNVEKTKLFKSFELENATNCYGVDRVLGQGGQGTVYKGILSDGRLVAVKKSKKIDAQNVEQFINEVVILSQINHRNIVKLLGCCLETEVPMLVYEFISNGTLFQHIHNPIEDFPLNWEVRLQISVEIAAALSYLHNSTSMPIFHRDVKSSNILLDNKYKAKVSDFGISRSVDVEKTHLTTQVKGTFGYLDPEYFQSNQFNEKSDVYSFGIVLVELLTGQKPIFSNTSQEFRGLASHFVESMEDNHLLKMIDPKILTENKIEEMVEVAHLAKACLNLYGRRRPTMKEVATQLEGIRMSRKQSIPRENCETNDVGELYDDSSNSTRGSTETTSTS